ncbi:MAG TPA: hypothetical protein VGB17_14210 [Pyrinomonadaceae bacterium]|jgi:recombinational DNA repair protein (RecF pathway)
MPETDNTTIPDEGVKPSSAPAFHTHYCASCKQTWEHVNSSLCKRRGRMMCDPCWDDAIGSSNVGRPSSKTSRALQQKEAAR